MATRNVIRVDVSERRLWRDAQEIRIKAKVFDLLCFFLSKPDRLLSKSDILSGVWPDIHVSDASVKDCVRNLRAALGDHSDNPVYIETVRGLGYRFLGGIEIVDSTLQDEETVAPTDRPPSPPPLLAPWRSRFLVAFPVVVVLALSLSLWTMAERSAPGHADPVSRAQPDEPSIAVLPFTTVPEDERSGLIARGLTDDLTTNLARLPQLFVSARGALSDAPDQVAAIGAVAERLGVRYLVKGSVKAQGERLRINVQLIDALTGDYEWSEQFETAAADLFTVQDDIMLGVLEELRVSLDEGERPRASHDTDNLDSWVASTAAYHAYLEFRPDSNQKARSLWQKALELDPDRAIPHAGLAFTHYYDAYRGWQSDAATSIRLATEHAEKAIERNPDHPLGYQALGAIAYFQGDHEKGLALRRKAAELAPNDFAAVGGLATFLSGTEHTEEAVRLFRKAIRLNPDPPYWVPVWFGHALQMNGQAEEAATWLERAVERNASYPYVHARLAAVYSDLGRTRDARSAAQEATRLDPEFGVHNMLRIFMFTDVAGKKRFSDWLSAAGLPE